MGEKLLSSLERDQEENHHARHDEEGAGLCVAGLEHASPGSVFHRGEVFDVRSLALAVELNNEREADGDYTQSAGGSKARVDLGTAFHVSIGVSYSF